MLHALIFAAVIAATPMMADTMTQEQAVELAQKTLRDKLKTDQEKLVVTSVQPMDWSDTSLGCPQPGMMYAQMITPGFKVVLQAGDAFYPVHVGGGRAVICTTQKRGRSNR